MLKIRNWIGVVSAPILLVSAGCSISQRPYSTATRGLSPERMMSLAKTFERQGHLPQAKYAYSQVLATQPGYPDAQQSLENLIAKEMRQHQKMNGNPTNQPNQLLAQQPNQLKGQSRNSNDTGLRPASAIKQSASASPAKVRSATEETSSAPQTPSLSSAPTMLEIQQAPGVEQPAALEPMPVVEQQQVAAQPIVTEQSPVVEPIRVAEQSSIVEPIPVAEQSPFDESTAEVEESLVIEEVPVADQSPVQERLPTVWKIPVVQPVPVASMAPATAGSAVADPAPVVSMLPSQQPAVVSVPAEDIETNPLLSDAEFFAPVKTIDTAKPWIDNRIESGPSVERVIDLNQVANAELRQFFGPFHMGIVQTLRAHRERFQGKLATIAADHTAENGVRSRAVFLLGTIGPDAIEVIPVLRRELRDDSDLYLRVELSEAILKIQPEDAVAINVLVECLKQPDQNLRWIAAFALRGAVSPRTTFVIDSLRAILPTDDLKLQRMVFLTLAEFGPAAAKVIPELEAALNSSDPATREVAKASLACIAPDRKTASKLKTASPQTELTLTD